MSTALFVGTCGVDHETRREDRCTSDSRQSPEVCVSLMIIESVTAETVHTVTLNDDELTVLVALLGITAGNNIGGANPLQMYRVMRAALGRKFDYNEFCRIRTEMRVPNP